jgi:hypothetical protein
MEHNKTLFRVSSVLATLVTGAQTREDERFVAGWASESADKRALVESLLDKTHYAENRALLACFPAGEAWEKIRRLINVMVDPVDFVTAHGKHKNTRPATTAGRHLNNQ